MNTQLLVWKTKPDGVDIILNKDGKGNFQDMSWKLKTISYFDFQKYSLRSFLISSSKL